MVVEEEEAVVSEEEEEVVATIVVEDSVEIAIEVMEEAPTVEDLAVALEEEEEDLLLEETGEETIAMIKSSQSFLSYQ